MLAYDVLPSPSAIIIDVTLNTVHKNSVPNLKQAALKALNAEHELLQQQSFWYASHIYTLYKYQNRTN